MSEELAILTATAASIGLVHTLLGPDHYLPFVAMSRARGWTRARTATVTAVCGLGHVSSSVVLGTVGLAMGVAVARVESIESVRGDVAAWLLIAFGMAYTVWGVRRAIRGRPHGHLHAHHDGSTHEHTHAHEGGHVHPHQSGTQTSVTPWVLFTVFLFGPCEPLIPILMYPAATDSGLGVAVVATVFGGVTILTMVTAVLLLNSGLARVPGQRLERYGHAMAGVTILLCGVAIHAGL